MSALVQGVKEQKCSTRSGVCTARRCHCSGAASSGGGCACGSGGDGAAEHWGVRGGRHSCPKPQTLPCSYSLLVVTVAVKEEHKTDGFLYLFPGAILTRLTRLSLGFLCGTSVKMFFLINNHQETVFYEWLGT